MNDDLKNSWVGLAGGLGAVAVLTFIDWNSWDLSISLFYVLVIGATSYHCGMWIGMIIALASAVCWTGANVLGGFPYIHWYAPYWNLGIRSVMFCMFSYLTTRLKNEATLQRLARTDPLTGVWNRRYFYEIAEVEIERSNRYHHVFTIVYLDIDGFKSVNDTMGHRVGDELLRTFAETIQRDLRTTDCMARLGGDEFAILLQETDSEDGARFLARLHQNLLVAMQGRGWNVTCSIGATTFIDPPSSVDKMLAKADDLMYLSKREGKNKITHGVAISATSAPK